MSQLAASLVDDTRVGRISRWRSERDLRQHARRNLRESDEDVLRRITRGDVDAVEVLHRRWGNLVHTNVRRIVREPALAEQVTEQVFGDLSTTACRFDPDRGDARTWLLALAHERAMAGPTDYPEPGRSAAASEPSTTSLATMASFRLLRRA